VSRRGNGQELPVGPLVKNQRRCFAAYLAEGRGGRLLILDEPTATLSEAESLPVIKAVRALAAGGSAGSSQASVPP